MPKMPALIDLTASPGQTTLLQDLLRGAGDAPAFIEFLLCLLAVGPAS
jgi:hypothetical protein